MERFLRYSLERGRAIRLIYQEEDGSMRQVNAQVKAMDSECIALAVLRPKKEITLPLTRLLSADYRKGDEGQA